MPISEERTTPDCTTVAGNIRLDDVITAFQNLRNKHGNIEFAIRIEGANDVLFPAMACGVVQSNITKASGVTVEYRAAVAINLEHTVNV